MNKLITEDQFQVEQLRVNEIKFLLSSSEIDWKGITERIESLPSTLESFPAKEGDVLKTASEWHDPSVYREAFTNEEYTEWLKSVTMKGLFETLKGDNDEL